MLQTPKIFPEIIKKIGAELVQNHQLQKTDTNTQKTAFYDKAAKPLVPLFIGESIRHTANVNTTSCVENLVARKVFGNYDKRLFIKLLLDLQRDPSILGVIGFVIDYIDCIKVYEVDRVDGDSD